MLDKATVSFREVSVTTFDHPVYIYRAEVKGCMPSIMTS